MLGTNFDDAPHKNSHWFRTATAAVAHPSLSGHQQADFVVVGGGLTGTRTALGLAESGAKVALLEGKSIGWGASGRSGGQCNPIWRETPDQLGKRLGDRLAARLIDTTLSCADDLFDDIRKYDIPCDPKQNGWLQAAHCKPAMKKLERLGDQWNAAGATIEFLDRKETIAASGSHDHGYSLFHPKGGHVQPLSLTRGFARSAANLGADLFEHSPVTAISQTDRTWTVTTPNGSITAAQVILTTNAYSNGLWPKLKTTYFPMVSIGLATEPLSPELRNEVLPNSVTIADSRRAIYFARYDRDHRLIFGCVGSSENPAVLGGIKRLSNGLTTVFPQLANIPIQTHWAGRIAVTPDMMPHLHEPEPGILAGLGFSGRGIAMTSVMARTLVKKALGASDETLPFPVSPIRSIPFHRAICMALPLAAPAMSMCDYLEKSSWTK